MGGAVRVDDLLRPAHQDRPARAGQDVHMSAAVLRSHVAGTRELHPVSHAAPTAGWSNAERESRQAPTAA